MSKTIRRKHVRDDYILERYCYGWHKKSCAYECFALQCKMDCPIRDKKATVKKYRRDTHSGYGFSVPKHYTKMINREKRAKDKAETRRILKQGDYEGYSYGPWKKDAGWWYW